MASKTEQNDLTLLIKSKNPIIVIETHEEERALELLARISIVLGQPLFGWHLTEGLRRTELKEDAMAALPGTEDPIKCLQHIKKMQRKGIYVLCDYHPFLDKEHPQNIRLIKDIAQDFPLFQQTLVFISHQIELPKEVKRFGARFELELPDPAQLEKMIRQEAAKWSVNNGGIKVRTDRAIMQRLVQNLTGLTYADARQIIRNIIYDDGAITEDEMESVNRARYQLLDLEGAVHYEYETAHFKEVGGMNRLKDWLELRKKVFLQANDFALDKPKGIMLVGVQGGGKSLAAKAVAGMWGVPLLRLDFGALYNKWHGESEKNLRDSLKLAEMMSPCVLWLDEVEKGISTGDNEGGTSKRVLGTLLTFMQENQYPIFMVATANDISALPPEFVRKGRLDEIFFVDLPDNQTRQEIFKIHLSKRKQVHLEFDVLKLAEATEGFSGAEIEQAIVAGLYASLYSDQSLDTQTILNEIIATSPLSQVMSEKMQALRAWAEGRAVIAN
ncbi:AAA family ATPase [Kangiella sp. TOML190]|uniref:AAA family ATPase n=1 Tax=Kangiella sp. TOML190 TaxID=2931351 RepID=UPI00203AE722|nr:AAA family ATPase [Kangiella sp. TOML190]